MRSSGADCGGGGVGTTSLSSSSELPVAGCQAVIIVSVTIAEAVANWRSPHSILLSPPDPDFILEAKGGREREREA